MTRLTEGMVIARTRATDLKSVRKLNCWGSELSDVSLVRHMPNVEVLSLSVNKITTLADFGHCPNLSELYVRKNMIHDLSEIIYLKDLPKLRNLWLEDNPCAVGDRYRLTVLRYLPNLKKLDNIAVEQDEVYDAQRYGNELEHPSEKHFIKESPLSPNTETPSLTPSSSSNSSPPNPVPTDRDYNVDSEGNVYPSNGNAPACVLSDNVHNQQKAEILSHADRRSIIQSTLQETEAKIPGLMESLSLQEETHATVRMTRRSRSEAGVTPTILEKEIVSPASVDADHTEHRGPAPPSSLAPTNCFAPLHTASIPTSAREYRDVVHVKQQQFHSHSFPPQSVAHSDTYGDDDHDVYRYSSSAQPLAPQHPLPTVHPTLQKIIYHPLQEKIFDSPNRPYPMRPKNRNSNILSAVLCLIKELDCAGLEVVEMAVRCRMEELDE